MTEDLVAHIDWLGDGSAPDAQRSYSTDDDTFVHVDTTYSAFTDFDDAAA
ncbi:MAG: hypothetical protein QNJ77_15030 [Acidimicrobiia bacterium]|nr:hypothetical protein [Acidimicrobiia bacterium]